jgi:hypothetical protein
MANLEYRFLLSKNSYFSAFFNSAMVKNNAANQKQFDFPYGFGAGAAIETKAGDIRHYICYGHTAKQQV